MSYFPGYEEIAATVQLDWKGLDRFDSPSICRSLPAGAHRLAPPPPPDPALLPDKRAVREPVVRGGRPRVSDTIGSFPREKHKYAKAPRRRDKATCPHTDGWHGNGKGTTPGTVRLQCRACGLNKQEAA